MGHYDDSYASTAEEDSRKRNEANRKALRRLSNNLETIKANLRDLEIEDEDQQHLTQKLTELEALLNYYVRIRND